MNTPWKRALVVLAALTASPCLAAEGRTPIAVPTTISSPGQYVVTRNIASGVGTIITIDADDVDLDLNGFLGPEEEVPKGCTDIRINFKVKADVDDLEKLKCLTAFSPVFNTLTRGVNVEIRVERK